MRAPAGVHLPLNVLTGLRIHLTDHRPLHDFRPLPWCRRPGVLVGLFHRVGRSTSRRAGVGRADFGVAAGRGFVQVDPETCRTDHRLGSGMGVRLDAHRPCHRSVLCCRAVPSQPDRPRRSGTRVLLGLAVAVLVLATAANLVGPRLLKIFVLLSLPRRTSSAVAPRRAPATAVRACRGDAA